MKKRNLLQRGLSVLLWIVLFAGIVLGEGKTGTVQAEEVKTETVRIDVAGTNNLTDGYYKISEDGTISESNENDYNIRYEQSIHTLTLNNAVFTQNSGPGIRLTCTANDAAFAIKLIGTNQITSQSTSIVVIHNAGSIPSNAADVEVSLNIQGNGSLKTVTTGTSGSILAANLTIEDSTLDLTSGGYTALRIERDLVVRNAKITTHDTGDGGDFYIDRSMKIQNSTIDMSDIQVEYPSIYLANNYCPDEYLIKPAAVVENSSLKIGGKKESSYRYALYVSKGGARISDSSLTAENDRLGIAVAKENLEISGTSTVNAGNQRAILGLEQVKIGEGVEVIGTSVKGEPLINDGRINLPESVTGEQLTEMSYYGGGTVKLGDETYHSVRFDLQDDTLLDEIAPQWILDGETASPLADPEKSGFEFAGWSETGAEVWDFQQGITKSMLFTPNWKEHTHIWSYALEGESTIRAVCSAKGCANPEQSVTIAAPTGNLIYDGSEKAASISGGIEGVDTPITYSTEDQSVPVNTGNYKASITLGGQTASAAYEITQAKPAVSDFPTVTDRRYHPSVPLGDNDLTGGSVNTGGIWKWKDLGVVPVVNNNGYEAVFIPDDGFNYKTVTRTIPVTVTKAVPYIVSPPTAAGITFGDTLSASVLSGGTVQYGNGAGGAGSAELVDGTFSWKNGALKPSAADSNITEYPVVFTPSDLANYEIVECRVKLIVQGGGSEPDAPVKNPEKKPDTPGQENGTGTVSKETQEKNGIILNSKLKVSQTADKITVVWGRVSDADGYEVYAQYCGKKFSSTPAASVKGTKTAKAVVKKVNGKKLNLKENYKVYVLAYKLVNGEKVTLGKTITVHVVGRKNTKCTNARAVRVKKSSYTLKKGRTAKIKATVLLEDKSKKQLSDAHAKEFRYATSNKKVATVSGTGKIKATGKGQCSIYVYARNGCGKKVKVTVK